MATGICYTQSGGTKKYDGIVVPAVAKGDKSYNPGYDNIKHDTSSVPGEDHYSFDDPSSYTLVEKGSSTRDDCPLIIVTYYPVAPSNPCYFNYKPIQTTDINYPVTISISGYTVHCSCERVTEIPGTNNGDFTLEVGITLQSNNQLDSVHFKWQMKDGIDEYKNVKYPYILSSEFFTRDDWEVTNSDGNKTHYRFVLHIK